MDTTEIADLSGDNGECIETNTAKKVNFKSSKNVETCGAELSGIENTVEKITKEELQMEEGEEEEEENIGNEEQVKSPPWNAFRSHTDSLKNYIRKRAPKYEQSQHIKRKFNFTFNKHPRNFVAGIRKYGEFVSGFGKHERTSTNTPFFTWSRKILRGSGKTLNESIRVACSVSRTTVGQRLQTISSTVAKHLSELSVFGDLLGDPHVDEELTAEDATKELKHVRELTVPLRERRYCLVSLKRRALQNANTKWNMRARFDRMVHDGMRFFDASKGILKPWKPLVHKVEGRFGPSGVAYFNFVLDLISLNLLLSLMTMTIVVLPVIYLQEDSNGTGDIGDWFLGWNYNASERWDGCPDVCLTKYNDKITNCSNLYLEQLKQDFNNYSTGSIQYIASGIAMEILMGKGRLEFTHLFLGYYPAYLELTDYPLGGLLVLCTALVFLSSLIPIVLKIGQWLRYNTTVREGAVFSKIVFTGYDFSLRHLGAICTRQMILKTELLSALNEDEFQRSKANRTSCEKSWIFVKRIIVNVVIQFITMLTCSVIWWFINIQRTIDDWLENFEYLEEWIIINMIFIVNYSDTIFIWLISIIVPPLLSKLGSYEQFSSRNTMLLYITRYGYIRLFSLMSVVISHLEAAGTRESDSCDINLLCWESSLAQKLYAQLVWDFVTRIGLVFFRLLYRILTVPCMYLKVSLLPELSIPDKVIDILFLQTICWISVPVSPLLPTLCFGSLSILLWFELLTALLFSKPTKRVFQAPRSSSMFMLVLANTWLWAAVSVILILVYIKPSLGCGPFRGLPAAWDALTHIVCSLDGNTEWIRDLLFSLDNRIVVIPVLTVLFMTSIYYLFVIRNRSAKIKNLEMKIKSIASDKAFLVNRMHLLQISEEDVSSLSLQE
ncbi:hypothetical protein SK128_005572 [Halocaridina rubra]|uniref:TMC domain-containing protein n=1 Tax=Halocaridina rubra TaxID=373956 RepID=A0AAN8XL58_HALRR